MGSFIFDLYGFLWDILFYLPLEIRGALFILLFGIVSTKIQREHLDKIFVFIAFLFRLLIIVVSFITFTLVALKSFSHWKFGIKKSILVKLENFFEKSIIGGIDDISNYFRSNNTANIKAYIQKINFLRIAIIIEIIFFLLPFIGIFDGTRLEKRLLIGISTWKKFETAFVYNQGIPAPKNDKVLLKKKSF